MRCSGAPWSTWARWVILGAVVIVVALLVRRYDIESYRDELQDLGDHVRRSIVVYSIVDEDTAIGVGSLVEAEVEVVINGQPVRGRFVSRVAGVPGEQLVLRPAAEGREIIVAGRRTWAVVPGDAPLEAGPIPADHYLLLDPVASSKGYDSRALGLIRRDQLTRKIIGSI